MFSTLFFIPNVIELNKYVHAVWLSFLITLFSDYINKTLIQVLAKYFGRKWFFNMSSGFFTHLLCQLWLPNEFTHSQRESFWIRVAKEPSNTILDRFNRAPTVTCHDWLMGCHCLEGNNAEVFILHPRYSTKYQTYSCCCKYIYPHIVIYSTFGV